MLARGGQLAGGQRHLERALGLSPLWLNTARDDVERKRAQQASAEISDILGLMARRRDDMAVARKMFEEAVETYRVLGNVSSQGRSLISLGSVSIHSDDHDEARRIYALSLELSPTTKDDSVILSAATLSLGLEIFSAERQVGGLMSDDAAVEYVRS